MDFNSYITHCIATLMEMGYAQSVAIRIVKASDGTIRHAFTMGISPVHAVTDPR